ncbi:polyprenyl synthetase family protein [Actinomadura sp. ATCC 39365]
MLRRDLLAVAELLADCVRADWPMFVRLSGVTDDLSAQTVRPSVLLLLASYLGGGERHPLIHALAAAADLGLLAALATDGTREERSSSGLPWGNRFSVLVADFFLARAFDFAAKAGGAVTADFSRALAAACQARARELRAGELGLPEYAEMLEGKLAIAFELPCRLGARLSGAPPATVTALAAYGRHLGVSFALIDDLRDGPGDADPAELRALAAEHAGLAHAALSVLPAGPVVDLLSALSGSVV